MEKFIAFAEITLAAVTIVYAFIVCAWFVLYQKAKHDNGYLVKKLKK